MDVKATQARIDALKAQEAQAIEEAGAEGSEKNLEDVRVSLSGMRDQRKFLEEQLAAHQDGQVTRVAPVTAEDASPDNPVGVELSDEVKEAHEELEGRIRMDRPYHDVRVALEASGGMPDQKAMMLALGSESLAEQNKVPIGQHGKQAVTIRLGAARELGQFLKSGRDVRDYLDLKLAYTTASGTAAGNIGDTIPTLVDSQFNQIDESINGIRRIPGVNMQMTATAAEQQWPLFREWTAGGNVSDYVGTENTNVTNRVEAYADEFSTKPREFVGFAEVSKNALAESAVSLMPAIIDGLARASARMTERAFAIGSGTNLPTGIFTQATGNNVQANAAGGRATADEILALPGQLPDMDGIAEPVWGVNRTNWYTWIRLVQSQQAVSATETGQSGLYAIAGNMYGMPASTSNLSSIKQIDGEPCYFFTYAPTATGATDYYLVYFSPSAYWIQEYEQVEITRDDSVGFMARRTTFLVSRWVDGQWRPTSNGNQARASIQGKA